MNDDDVMDTMRKRLLVEDSLPLPRLPSIFATQVIKPTGSDITKPPVPMDPDDEDDLYGPLPGPEHNLPSFEHFVGDSESRHPSDGSSSDPNDMFTPLVTFGDIPPPDSSRSRPKTSVANRMKQRPITRRIGSHQPSKVFILHKIWLAAL